MRYYNLTISPISGGGPSLTFTSHPNGPQQPPDPGALQVEFDIKVTTFATPDQVPSGGGPSGSLVRIWGIPLSLIAQAKNLSAPASGTPTYKAVLKGGMGKGLPLANPNEIGTLIQGTIWRAIGNWIGVDMTLDLYLSPLSSGISGLSYSQYGTDKTPNLPIGNYSIHWVAGQPMGPAIQAALQAAMPGATIVVSISPQLIVPTTEDGYFSTAAAFADEVKSRSISILGPGNPNYNGVDIKSTNGIISVYDLTQETSNTATPPNTTVGGPAKMITPTDLIGQPTWIGNNEIQVTTVLRGDIDIGNQLTLPPTLTTAGANTVAQGALINNFPLAFNGNWVVLKITHVGNYKSPSPQQWVSVFDCTNPTQPTTLPASPPPMSSPPPTPAPLDSVPQNIIAGSP